MPLAVGKTLRKMGLYDETVLALQAIERIQRPRKIHQYLATHAIRKLQIGSDVNIMDDWLNTDLFISHRSLRDKRITFLDATKRFPFADHSFDYAFSEHMIEHIPWTDGLYMLRETIRVLKPHGTIRIATPNLCSLLDLYRSDRDAVQNKYVHHMIERWQPQVAQLDFTDVTFVLNDFMRNWGHQFVYDPAVLCKLLKQAGFSDIREVRPGKSNDPHLCGIEFHQRHSGVEFNDLETMVFEADKPG